MAVAYSVSLNDGQRSLYDYLNESTAIRQSCTVEARGNGLTVILALLGVQLLQAGKNLVYVTKTEALAVVFWNMVRMYLPAEHDRLLVHLKLAIAPPDNNLKGIHADVFLVDHLPTMPLLLLPFVEMPQRYNESTVIFVRRIKQQDVVEKK